MTSKHRQDSEAVTLTSEISNLKSSMSNRTEAERDSELQQIREALSGLRFGSVVVVVQDGVVVQIDRTEKRRLQRRTGVAGGECR
jgi:hypothetical protein